MLLDEVLPTYDVRDAHGIWVRAPPERVYQALREVTPAEVPLFRLLFALRLLPGRLTGPHVGFGARRPLLAQFVDAGFVLLAEHPDAEVVLGRVAQFWKPWGGRAAPVRDATTFTHFAAPGFAKAAINFVVTRDGGGTRLVTETRVAATDATARRRFVTYWWLIRRGSALIRRDWLRAIKRRVERE